MINIPHNTKLTVITESNLYKNLPYYMTSSFEGALGGNELLISAPLYRGLHMPLRPGEKLKVSFLDNSSGYGFDAVVLERVERDGLQYFKIKQISELTHVQRREDFRLRVTMEGKLDQAYLDEYGRRRVRRRSIVTRDVSAGGAYVRLNWHIEVGEMTVIYLPLGKNESIQGFQSEVRWFARAGHRDAVWKYECGLRFIHKNLQEKEALIKRLFVMQHNMRKKEVEREM